MNETDLLHQDAYKTIPILEDRCPILESFLELAGDRLEIPSDVVQFVPQPFFTSIARASVAANITATEIFPQHVADAGFAEVSQKLLTIGDLSSQQNLHEFSAIYSDFLKVIQQKDDLRSLRVTACQTGVIVTALSRFQASLAMKDPNAMFVVATEVGTVSVSFTALISSLSAPVRQKILDRLLEVRVRYQKNQDLSVA